MIDGFIVYIDNVVSYLPKFIDSINETGIMMAFAMVAAIILGLPVGTLLFLTDKGQELENKYLYFITNALVNIIRSFPFLLLVIAMQPLIREIYGRATGDPIAASCPLMVIAIALYSRVVQQSLLEVPKGLIQTSKAMGRSIRQCEFQFSFVEARSSLIIGFTTAFVSFISYSTIMGVVGGGGIGDFAIRYGYQRYETDIMYTAIVIIIIFVQVAQWFGFKLAKKLDKR